MKEILFVINPISGTRSKKRIPYFIEQESKKSKFKFQIKYTERAKHATEITQNEKNNFDVIVAVGGDGTVNEVANGIIGGRASLGIIPMGSGNGLARYLKYSMNVKKSIAQIAKFDSHQIDHININKAHNSFNVCGVGFDAHISKVFENYGKRGLISYMKLIINEFFSYKEKQYQMKFDGSNEIVKNAFAITFANSTQFGNNAHICPQAVINDGFIDICVLKKIPLWASPIFVYQLMSKKLHKSRFCEYYKAKTIELKTSDEIPFHIDGEFVGMEKILNVDINNQSLSALNSRL
jgi:YegS/Rv2252/BmrU family lipid kinase